MIDAYGKELAVGDRVAYTVNIGGKLFCIRKGTITKANPTSCSIQPDEDSQVIIDYRQRRYQWARAESDVQHIKTSAKVVKCGEEA